MSFGSDLDERIQLLRGIWLFSTCDDDELARIAAVATPREAELGAALTVQGDEGTEDPSYRGVHEGRSSDRGDGNVSLATPGPNSSIPAASSCGEGLAL